VGEQAACGIPAVPDERRDPRHFRWNFNRLSIGHGTTSLVELLPAIRPVRREDHRALGRRSLLAGYSRGMVFNSPASDLHDA
jgi:hypothetical protein